MSALSRLSARRPCLSVCQQEDAESPGPLKIVSMPTICKLISLSFPLTLLPFGKNHIWSDGHVTLEKESLRASMMYTCDVIVVKLNALQRHRAISLVTENERWLYNFERNLFSDKKQTSKSRSITCIKATLQKGAVSPPVFRENKSVRLREASL